MRVSRLLCGANGTPPKKKNTKSPLKNRRTCFPRNLPIKFSFRGSTGTSRQHGANVTDSVSGAYAGKSTHHHHDYSFHHTPFDEPPSHKHIYKIYLCRRCRVALNHHFHIKWSLHDVSRNFFSSFLYHRHHVFIIHATAAADDTGAQPSPSIYALDADDGNDCLNDGAQYIDACGWWAYVLVLLLYFIHHLSTNCSPTSAPPPLFLCAQWKQYMFVVVGCSPI